MKRGILAMTAFGPIGTWAAAAVGVLVPARRGAVVAPELLDDPPEAVEAGVGKRS